MKINATRISDGAKILIEHEDCGDTVPAFRDNGAPFRAYTSRFTVGGDPCYVQTDADKADDSGNVAQFRQTEDTAALVALGYEYGPEDLIGD